VRNRVIIEKNWQEEIISKRSGQLKYPKDGVTASVGLPAAVVIHKKHNLHHTRVLRGCVLRFGLRDTEWIVLRTSLVIPPQARYTSLVNLPARSTPVQDNASYA
jgi:hypothetical protein